MTEKSPNPSAAAGASAAPTPPSPPSPPKLQDIPNWSDMPQEMPRYPRWMVNTFYKGFAMGPPRHAIERSKKHVRPHYVWLTDLPKPEPDHNPAQPGEGA